MAVQEQPVGGWPLRGREFADSGDPDQQKDDGEQTDTAAIGLVLAPQCGIEGRWEHRMSRSEGTAGGPSQGPHGVGGSRAMYWPLLSQILPIREYVCAIQRSSTTTTGLAIRAPSMRTARIAGHPRALDVRKASATT